MILIALLSSLCGFLIFGCWLVAELHSISRRLANIAANLEALTRSLGGPE